MILSVVNTKGGVGKTTSAIFLGVAFTRMGHSVVVLDMDKQGSASSWADRAEEAGSPLPFPVEIANAARLSKLIAGAGAGTIVIVDTPPGDTHAIDSAVAVSDFVVIPTQASGIELERVWLTLESLETVPHGVLITSARLGTRALEDAVGVLEEEGVGVFSARIPIREQVRAAWGGVPGSDLSGYGSVANEIAEVVL